jgi:uncharacterized membrane protein YhaH (DUF805 family)
MAPIGNGHSTQTVDWQARLNPDLLRSDTIRLGTSASANCMPDAMEELFEFLFGASGRVNRAKYWRAVLRFSIAGLMVAVILFIAAGVAAPIFVATVVLIFIPWLIWGLAMTTERLHDRDKSAWWLVTFYLAPGLLGQFAKTQWLEGRTGAHYVLTLAGFALTIWGFTEIGCLRGTSGPNTYGPDPLLRTGPF